MKRTDYQNCENCRYARWGQTDKEWVYVLWCELGQCICIDDACLFYEEDKERDENTETVSAEDDR